MTTFAHRGVIEGFYGRPWLPDDRRWLIERLGRWGMNRYVYAPKNDPLHREQWRTPYPDATMREFADLVATGGRVGVDVGFAVSPGLSIRYGAADDGQALVAKLRTFTELGVQFLCLALDDVPSELASDDDRRTFGTLARAHVHLAHVLRAAFPTATLWLVPTDYLGVAPTDYLEELGALLDPSIEVGWTGRTIVSPTIRTHELACRAATLRRRVLVWDNTPVADGPMNGMLHLGPYVGRDADLAIHASGVMLNPMEHARASAVTLRTAADFLRDPAGYDPEHAWGAAIAEVGEGAGDAFRLFAEAHRFSPLRPEDRDRDLEPHVTALVASPEGPAAATTLAALEAAVAARADAAAQVRSGVLDRPLVAEIEPWLAAHANETQRLAAAVDLLQALAWDAPRSMKTMALFQMQHRLLRHPAAGVTSYGPRRVLYPQLVSMRDDGMGFAASEPSLVRDRSLVDQLVRLAEDRAMALLQSV